MRELNALTKHLLSLGYTKENPPPGYCQWNDYYGGWTYSYKQESNIIVEAPCGVISNSRYLGYCSQVGYGGINWCLENDNALMRCPYNKKNCELNDPIVRNSEWAGRCWCKVKITHRAFDYELSAEKIEARNKEAYEDKVKRFAESQVWFCREHLSYDKYNDKFELEFNPMSCIGHWCPYCEMRGRELTAEKGNVFYDVKETRVIDRGDLLGEEVKVTVTKGERLFEKAENLDKCKAIATRPDLVRDKVIQRGRRSSDLFFAQYHGLKYKIEILNVRAEKRESRDLEKDLADISEGVAVFHASDLLELKKQAKRTRAF